VNDSVDSANNAAVGVASWHSPVGPAAVRSESPRRDPPAFRWSWKLATLAGIDLAAEAGGGTSR
jgi:hypothetical protein